MRPDSESPGVWSGGLANLATPWNMVGLDGVCGMPVPSRRLLLCTASLTDIDLFHSYMYN